MYSTCTCNKPHYFSLISRCANVSRACKAARRVVLMHELNRTLVRPRPFELLRGVVSFHWHIHCHRRATISVEGGRSGPWVISRKCHIGFVGAVCILRKQSTLYPVMVVAVYLRVYPPKILSCHFPITGSILRGLALKQETR